jgi:hypothetical protein
MRLLIIIYLLSINASPLLSQVDSSKERMNLGTAIGYKAPYGVWGLFYSYKPSVIQNRFELSLGAGINHSFIIGGGLKFRIFSNKTGQSETLLSINYSYNFSGEVRKEYGGFTEYYKTSEAQVLSYSIYQRFYFSKKRSEALQLGLGYSQIASGYNLSHVAGTNTGFSKINKKFKSGLCFEIGLIINFLQLKKD